jgi:hypothetical protein
MTTIQTNRMKNKNYLTVEIIPKDNIKFAERGKIDTTVKPKTIKVVFVSSLLSIQH